MTTASMKSVRSAALAVLSLLIAGGLQAQELTPEQVVSLQSVASPAMSPDGRWIAYNLVQPRDSAEERGSSYRELYVISAEGGEPRSVVQRPRSAGAAKWAPDGSRVAFVARLPQHDQAQVYAVPAEGGDPVRLTSSTSSIGSFEWSPDGSAIAYTAPWPGDAPERDPLNDVIVLSEQGRYTGLWVQPVDGGEARAVTPRDRNVVGYAWRPDGEALAVQATTELGADADQMFRDLYVVSASGGEMHELTETPGKLGAMAWSPDGRRLAFMGATSFNDPLAQSVMVAPAEGGAARNLTPDYEGSVVSLDWLDAGTLLFVADESTVTTLNRVPAGGGAIQRLAGGGDEIFGAVSFDSRKRTFAAAVQTSRHPAELYVGQLRGGDFRRLTHHNGWLDGVALGRQETIAWTGAEGWNIEGVLIYPVGYAEGRRYPLAILPHGGPEGVSLNGWTTNPLYPAQVLAGRGYAVLMPNYRGSGGRGVEFSKGDHRDLGGREFEDVIAGIDHLAGIGIVDADRVGISGTSYGGYFSAWAATRYSDRFKAAIPFAGLTNWMSFMLTTDIPVEMSVVHFDLWCTENVGLCWDRSPVAHIDDANTPTLIGHGLADDRVHPEQSLELYNALRLSGVPVELVQYPREPHGLLERAHQLDYMRRVTDWLDRYLR